MSAAGAGETQWATAVQVAALLAIDPIGLGGATIRAPAGPVRDAWLGLFRDMVEVTHDVPVASPPRKGEGSSMVVPLAPRPWRRLPPGVADSRLIGGLDLAATLAAGRPVAERGLLGEADGGTLVVPMAERLGEGSAATLCAALDTGEVVVERDGIATRTPARFSCLLLDEGRDDERAPAALTERLAFTLDLSTIFAPPREADGVIPALLENGPPITVPDDAVAALCAAGTAFGVPSLRVATLALRTAKAAAALAGRDAVAEEDVTLAAALVLAPRATTLPVAESDQAAESEGDDAPVEPPRDAPGADDLDQRMPPDEGQALTDRVVEATRAAIPAGLLAELALAAAGATSPGASGKAGAARQSAKRGRLAGVRRGLPGHGARLAVVETLRAAAPWQPLRRAQLPSVTAYRVLVRREDFRIARYKQKSETLTLFVVDASGSAALHRLAEVKGAVELILAECYVRRDSVALIAFRGTGADFILPPTRSLVRAKRALAGQAGGGGTPLATAIEAATLVASAAARKGQTPIVVYLTDGKANIGRAGQPGRAAAEADALAAARAFRARGCAGLLLDIAPRPGEAAHRLATAMGARYVPLPYADAQALSRVVLAAGPVAAGMGR